MAMTTMRLLQRLMVAAILPVLGGCATVHNLPLNMPSANPMVGFISQAGAAPAPSSAAEVARDGNVLALSFSGGGTRAAAFSFGVLEELERTRSPDGGRDMLDHLGLLSGVSGGAVMAAYYGLKGRASLVDFREQFLVQDLMAQLRTSIDLVNIGRALSGGVNTDERLRGWMNERLFRNATLGTLAAQGRPITLINATDIYSRTPFLFTPLTFAALCSDYESYPVAAAVAASAAVPGAFAPIVVEAFPDQCRTPLPPEIERASRDAANSPLVHAYARSLERVRTGRVKFVKLLDGGLVDNYGLAGINIGLSLSNRPSGLMNPRDAINMRRLLFLVVDAGRGPQGDWAQTVEGPTGTELVSAVVDAIVDANTYSSYSAFEANLDRWRQELIRWRCSLNRAEVTRLRGSSGPWNCRDLTFTVGRVSFDQLDATRAAWLHQVPTSFTLPPQAVDEVRQAGSDALRANAAFQNFLRAAR